MKLYDDLVWRGLIKDVAGDNLEEVLNGEPITFYWGTDPTADSLHIGHYSSLVTAKRLAKYGHHPILLCGGATGRIGDPRPTAEREIISKDNPLTAAIRQSIIARKRLFEANLCKDCYLANTGCPKDGGCYGILGTEDLYLPGYTCAIRKKAPVLKEIIQAYSTQ